MEAHAPPATRFSSLSTRSPFHFAFFPATIRSIPHRLTRPRQASRRCKGECTVEACSSPWLSAAGALLSMVVAPDGLEVLQPPASSATNPRRPCYNGGERAAANAATMLATSYNHHGPRDICSKQSKQFKRLQPLWRELKPARLDATSRKVELSYELQLWASGAATSGIFFCWNRPAKSCIQTTSLFAGTAFFVLLHKFFLLE